MYGNMIRMSSAVSSTFPGVLAKPLGEKHRPATARRRYRALTSASSSDRQQRRDARRRDRASRRSPRARLIFGEYRHERHARTRRRQTAAAEYWADGMRLRNASILQAGAEADAFRLSRMSPVIRDSSVNALTVDSALSRFIARRACASPKRACACFIGRADRLWGGLQDEEATKRANRQRFRLAPNPESRYYARSFRVLHRTLGQTCIYIEGTRENRVAITAGARTFALTVAIEDSRTWQTLPKPANVPGKEK